MRLYKLLYTFSRVGGWLQTLYEFAVTKFLSLAGQVTDTY